MPSSEPESGRAAIKSARKQKVFLDSSTINTPVTRNMFVAGRWGWHSKESRRWHRSFGHTTLLLYKGTGLITSEAPSLVFVLVEDDGRGTSLCCIRFYMVDVKPLRVHMGGRIALYIAAFSRRIALSKAAVSDGLLCILMAAFTSLAAAFTLLALCVVDPRRKYFRPCTPPVRMYKLICFFVSPKKKDV